MCYYASFVNKNKNGSTWIHIVFHFLLVFTYLIVFITRLVFVMHKIHKLLLLNDKYIIYTLPHSPKLWDFTIAKSTLAILHSFSHKLSVFFGIFCHQRPQKLKSYLFYYKINIIKHFYSLYIYFKNNFLLVFTYTSNLCARTKTQPFSSTNKQKKKANIKEKKEK